MVKTWAEKEMRNLARLRAAGIPAPAPLLLRMHVLVMEFIGDDGVAAPRLKVGWGRDINGGRGGAGSYVAAAPAGQMHWGMTGWRHYGSR